ncbi:MAG: IS66 family transposase [Saprospiraceae bacterium]|nr:IS66 family transposase [Saprospiraceae bacterium]
MQKQVAILMANQAALTERLNKNSRNSHKPPSSDGLQKPASRPAFARNKGRKPGGKPGHKGRTLEICEQPDHFNELLPDKCTCGHVLDKSRARVVEVRQVFDLPQPRLEVTEHIVLSCSCERCGSYNQGAFPDGVNARLQYGTGVRALVVLLNVAFKLPVKKVQILFEDLYGLAINPATIIGSTRRCFERLGPVERLLRDSLLQSMVNHLDETGLRVAGSLHWLHTCCNGLFTYLFVHAKRGTEALQGASSNLPVFKGWAVHDCWGSYFGFDGCRHAVCGAHLLRELAALEENGTAWAAWFRRYLLALYRLSDHGKGSLAAVEQEKALRLFGKIWENADMAEPLPRKSASGRGKPKATKGRNLLLRLRKHQAAVIAFAFHEEVPFTNNQAERDLRPAKTKQKVSGSFRTLVGAQVYARIFSFISTARKHQSRVFNELKNAFEGNTFLNKACPS